MNVYGLKNCDACRKARKALDGASVAYDFRDIRETPPTTMQIGRWMKEVGADKLLNTRSTTWRSLPTAEKDGVAGKEGVDEKKAAALMAAHPTLIKRPVIENGPTQVFAGWTKDVQDAVLG